MPGRSRPMADSANQRLISILRSRSCASVSTLDDLPKEPVPVAYRAERLEIGVEADERAQEEDAVPGSAEDAMRELHEGPARLLRARDHPFGVPDVRLEQGPLPARRRLERALDRLPEVAAADRGREPPDRQHAARAPGGDVGHGRGPCAATARLVD